MYDINKLYQPKTLKEALDLKKKYPNALTLAGGSDILIQIREGKLANKDLISIYMIDELRGIYLQDDGTIVIKPLTSFSHVTSSEIIQKYVPTLGYATDQVGGPQTRNIGTIGGNICNGITSADSATTLKAYDAILEISHADYVREMPYRDFNIWVGEVDLKEGEILTAIKIPKESYENTYGWYIKYAKRAAMDIATLGCSVNVRLSNDKKVIERIRISYGVAGPVPLRVATAEEFATGKEITQDLIEGVVEKVLEDVKPRNSWRASKEFRLQLIKEMLRRCLKSSIEKAGGII